MILTKEYYFSLGGSSKPLTTRFKCFIHVNSKVLAMKLKLLRVKNNLPNFVKT